MELSCPPLHVGGAHQKYAAKVEVCLGGFVLKILVSIDESEACCAIQPNTSEDLHKQRRAGAREVGSQVATGGVSDTLE